MRMTKCMWFYCPHKALAERKIILPPRFGHLGMAASDILLHPWLSLSPTNADDSCIILSDKAVKTQIYYMISILVSPLLSQVIREIGLVTTRQGAVAAGAVLVAYTAGEIFPAASFLGLLDASSIDHLAASSLDRHVVYMQ